MERRWLIIADDLTGAADCASAFAQRGRASCVTWGDADPAAHAAAAVIAYDAESRARSVDAAASGNSAALRRWLAPGMNQFKKIDSTMRGYPGAEIGALLQELVTRSKSAFGIFAPAFPAGGRTTRDGRVFVQGVPLEDTQYPSGGGRRIGTPLTLLEHAGVRAELVPLATVRAGGDPLRAAFAAIQNRGAYRGVVAVCDAETDQDLDRIVAASPQAPDTTLFIGSAGLAHALARADGMQTRPAPRGITPSNRGALIVVGSLATASLAASEALGAMPQVKSINIDRWTLGPQDSVEQHAALIEELLATLEAGDDVAVGIGWGAGEYQEYAIFPHVVVGLARVLAPVAARASGLVATGGETAIALLKQSGANGIAVVDEIEPGMCLGLTLGDRSVPCITKSGGFGDDGCLVRAVERLRLIRQTGTVA